MGFCQGVVVSTYRRSELIGGGSVLCPLWRRVDALNIVVKAMAVVQPGEDTVFEAALEIKDPAERGAFLVRACEGDLQLRTKIEKLLSAHDRAEEFFADCKTALTIGPDQQPVDAATEAGPGTDEQIGSLVGPYKLLQKIGEGGCGAVYMAEQQKPMRRRVAVKIIKLGMDTKAVIARFEAERQALALMDHPDIARVLDAGATETGRPYFVMELVHGIRITDYCDQRQLDTRQRLELFIQVCHAIQHAHQKGIIHRDIKPSNILVTLHDGVPVPKVIDFGIAKATEERLTDKTLFTVYGHFIGTPAYMSPEQADFSGLDIDTRSDIYSLGVLLYELLTGRTPFDQSELLASGLDAMRRTLRECEPHRPSTKLDALPADELTATATRRHIEPPKLRLLLKGDLDWVVMKCLEKDRKRRYETANGVAMDVQRYLNHEPVLARPPSRWYRFRKLVRRNRVIFAATGIVILALVTGLGTATAMFFKERQMRHRAVVAEQKAEEARANEAELRREAETREKITRAALFVSEGKFADADKLAAATVFQEPTLEGAAVLRTLGKWHALNGRWRLAGDRLLQALRVDQLDSDETVSLDFLCAGATLAAADDTNTFKLFRHHLALRFAEEKNLVPAERVLKSALLFPANADVLNSLQSLAQTISPSSQVSIGSLRPSGWTASGSAAAFLKQLVLQDVGTRQPCSMRVDHGGITIVAGGANIWETNDEFAYACAPVSGDFDFRMRVRSIVPAWDPFTRVGLMAREFPDQPDSRHIMVAVNAQNSFQVLIRSVQGAPAASVPQNPLPAAYGSNSWVRLQRVGALFLAYTSSNGVDWTQLYQTTGGNQPFNDPIFFGIAASSHDTNGVATNVVSDFGPTPVVPVDTALTLALLEYRRGNFAQSAVWCQRLLAYPECNPVQTATTHVILALAGWRLNQVAEAEAQLAQSRDSIQNRFSGGLQSGDQTDGFWYDWIVARVLLQEAEGLIH
jgi:eukaryotic-like serine/threonine-protein kinase